MTWHLNEQEKAAIKSSPNWRVSIFVDFGHVPALRAVIRLLSLRTLVMCLISY